MRWLYINGDYRLKGSVLQVQWGKSKSKRRYIVAISSFPPWRPWMVLIPVREIALIFCMLFPVLCLCLKYLFGFCFFASLLFFSFSQPSCPKPDFKSSVKNSDFHYWKEKADFLKGCFSFRFDLTNAAMSQQGAKGFSKGSSQGSAPCPAPTPAPAPSSSSCCSRGCCGGGGCGGCGCGGDSGCCGSSSTGCCCFPRRRRRQRTSGCCCGGSQRSQRSCNNQSSGCCGGC